MKVSIEYCRMWNYEPTATGLAGRIKDALGLEVELIAGSGGVFEVTADGDLIFSKKAQGRFPEAEEVLGPLEKRVEGA